MERVRHLRFGPFRLDAVDERLWRGSEEIALSPKPFAMLRYLVEHRGRLVTTEEVLDAVWNGTHVTSTSPRVCLHEIREALREDASAPCFIETVPRRGYRFVASVTGGDGEAVSLTSVRYESADLIGRAGELARLDEWLEHSLAGVRRIAFVTGEAGIGKTTLVDAFVARRPPALRLARGQCIEHYSTSEPYLPVFEAFERSCRSSGGEVVIEVLRRHAPLWLAQMPSVVSAAERESLREQVAGATRERMLREMADAIEELSNLAPLILWLEDLHGSDNATLDLLAFLARRREPARLLVIGTYRPSVVRTGEHPLYAIQQELQVRGWCHELALEPLSKESVATYLATRFESGALDAASFRDAADIIHRRTEGNPLFLVSTVDAVLGLTPDGGSLLGVTEEVCRSVPSNVSEFLEQQIEHLCSEDRLLLEAASVAGMECSAAAVAAGLEEGLEDVERRCAELARRGQFLKVAGSEEWPDGTVTARFRFAHALHQEVLYARVTPARGVGLHRRIGERLVRGWGERVAEIAPELAMHFERGRVYDRAVEFLRLAGASAMRRYAAREAESVLSAGIRLLQNLPDSTARDHQEIALRVALGPALATTRGYADPSVQATYTRARDLCRRLGKAPEIFPVLQGLWIFSLVRGELQSARDLGLQLLKLAQTVGDPTLLLEAHQALGVTSHFLGDWAAAESHATQGMALYDRRERPSNTVHSADDPGVMCLVTAASALWARGFPEQGLARSEQAIALARELSHPLSLGVALISYCCLSLECRREDSALTERLSEAIALFTAQGLPLMLAIVQILDGVVRGRDGAPGAAPAEQMIGAMAAFEATGAKWLRPYFQAWLARTYGEAGRYDEGLTVIEGALREVAAGSEGYYTAEAWRLKGELSLRRARTADARRAAKRRATGASTAVESQSEACFRKAIEIARRQGARALELRAVIDLARLRRTQGRKSEARRELAVLHAVFTEGFDTSDMRAAEDLLDELAVRSR